MPGDSLIGDCLHTCGGVICAQGCNTRWESSREIDWFATNLRDALSQPCCSDLYLSDHKLILADFLVPPRDRTVGVLPSTPDWTKPAGISTADWRAALEQSWELHRPDDSIFMLPVQEAWDVFNCSVDDMFRTALTTLAQWSTDLVQQRKLVKLATVKMRKGALGKWTARSTVKKGPSETSVFFQVQKLRRKLGRLHELKQVALLLIREHSAQRQILLGNLLHKLCRHYPELTDREDDLGFLVQFAKQQGETLLAVY